MDRHAILKICRLCLLDTGTVDIFKKKILRDHIYNCIGVRVSRLDSLPQSICKSCLEIVEKAAKLRNVGKRNDVHLKYIFDAPKGRRLLQMTSNQNSSQTSSISSTLSETSSSTTVTEFSTRTPESKSEEENELHEATLRMIQSMKPPNPNPPSEIDDDLSYACPVCSKKFYIWRKLLLHSRVHKKKNKCTVTPCNKKFSSKGDLEKHLRTHTGEKPFRCNECNKMFTQCVSLKLHKERMHSKRGPPNCTEVGSRNESTEVGSRNESTEVGNRNESTEVGSRNESTEVGSRNESTEVGSRNESTEVGSRNESTEVGSRNESA